MSNTTTVSLPLYPQNGNPEQFADIEFGTLRVRMVMHTGATSKNGLRLGELLAAPGYRASASFNHAFERWTGRRPVQASARTGFSRDSYANAAAS